VGTRLAFKLPTWKVNINLREDDLRNEFKYMSPGEFNMEFGAEFSGTAGEKYVPDQYVDKAIALGVEIGLEQRLFGIKGQIYYAHLDPASSSHNYALVVVHVEERIRSKEKNGVIIKERNKLLVVDHVKVWQPTGGESIKVSEVDNYIIDLSRRFRFAMVSYDNWNSQSSVQLLRRKRIPTKITPFRRPYKMAIYDNLEQLLVNGQIVLPYKGPESQLLEMELKCLKRVYTWNGYKTEPNPEGLIKTDDIADSLAAACYVATESINKGYASSVVVKMPQSSINTQQWNIGRGSYNDGDKQWQYLKNRLF